ncbi:MAG: DUF4179 domain-containing protein [Oscillospiraceae bacterium]|nr:DUF4179 domain-containing protein [Oscillospiraceae bacterium]
MKKHKFRITIAVALALVCVLSAALAASVQFGVLEFLTLRDKNGNIVGEERLAPLVQSLNLIHETNDFTLTLNDFICDGAALSAAWTLDAANSTDALFLSFSLTIDEGVEAIIGFSPPEWGRFIAGGEIVHDGAIWELQPEVIAEDGAYFTATLHYEVLRSSVALFTEALPDSNDQDDWNAYYAARDKAESAGKLVVQAGQLLVPPYLKDAEEGTNTERMIAAGLVERADQFDMQFPVMAANPPRSGLIANQPVEKTLDGYTIRVTRADIYDNATIIKMEYIFDTKEDMLRIAHNRPTWEVEENGELTILPFAGCYIGSLAETKELLSSGQRADEAYSALVIDGFSANTDDIYRREDGKWVVPLEQRAFKLLTDASETTIVPLGIDEGGNEVFYWEDAIELGFEYNYQTIVNK